RHPPRRSQEYPGESQEVRTQEAAGREQAQSKTARHVRARRRRHPRKALRRGPAPIARSVADRSWKPDCCATPAEASRHSPRAGSHRRTGAPSAASADQRKPRSSQHRHQRSGLTGPQQHRSPALSGGNRSPLRTRAQPSRTSPRTSARAALPRSVHGNSRTREQATQSKNYVDAIASLEQARLRVPDSRLESLLGAAKKKAQEQAGEKRREQYIKSARTSLARGDAASAVVTLEMAQSEFGA